MRLMKAIAVGMTALPLALSAALAAQPNDSSAAVFALITENEWCPGGSVFLDLRTGSFMLHPRLTRPACADPKVVVTVEHGTLHAPVLKRIQSAYAAARRAGLRRDKCDFIVSNGGPEVVVITAPGFAATTPEDEGCWSKEATALHHELFEAFGRQRERHP